MARKKARSTVAESRNSYVSKFSSLAEQKVLDDRQLNQKISLLDLLNLLQENRSHIAIDLQDLQDNYHRKGIKRIKGFRDDDRTLFLPRLNSKFLDSGKYVRLESFAMNRNTATINMSISRPVKLVEIGEQTPIDEVAGLLFPNQETFQKYTIVNEGKLNIKSLKVKIGSKEVFELLKEQGVLEGKFSFQDEYIIRLDNLAIAPVNFVYSNLDGVFDELAEIKVLSSILSACLKERSDIYTSEQLAELHNNYLSKNLYINFPTTTEYSDLKEALSQGNVNSRLSYKIDIGNKDILNLGKLYSANKFLDRMYEVYNTNTGEKLEKPTFDITLEENVIFGHKTLSSRTKATKVDELMQRIFDDLLGIENNGSVAAILSKGGANNLRLFWQGKWQGEKVDRDEFVAALTAAKDQLKDYAEKLYREKVSPLVFYIGSTGLLPEGIDSQAQTAEELAIKYPNLQFSKYEQKGRFFEVGNTIISLYLKKEYYTPKIPA